MAYKIKNKTKMIKVDFNNLQSIRNAERMKTRLENQGYNLKRDWIAGFDKIVLEYEK